MKDEELQFDKSEAKKEEKEWRKWNKEEKRAYKRGRKEIEKKFPKFYHD